MQYKEQETSDYFNLDSVQEAIDYGLKFSNDNYILDAILRKAQKGKGLAAKEAAVLFLCRDSKYTRRIQEIAEEIKKKNFGDRVLLTAVVDLCEQQKRLSAKELESCIVNIQEQGYKRVLLVAKEPLSESFAAYLLSRIKQSTMSQTGNGEIRRLSICVKTGDCDYSCFANSGVSLFCLWNEYDFKEASRFWKELFSCGYDDFGLMFQIKVENYLSVLLEYILQMEYMENVFGAMIHEIYLSIDFLDHAAEMDLEEFRKRIEISKTIIAVLRLAMPYTELGMSYEDIWKINTNQLTFGVSQIYVGKNGQEDCFLEKIVKWLLGHGYLPSFCAACFQAGRRGSRYLALIKAGKLIDCCQNNALLTLQEYLEEQADDDTKKEGEQLIAEKMKQISNDALREKTAEFLDKIKNGRRNFRI